MTQSPGKSRLEAMMKELQGEYLDSLPQKVLEIELALKKKNVAELREDFHKLKGTGKTYGFPEISELSELMEILLIEQPEVSSRIVPEAIGILKDIYRERLASRDFDLRGDGRFHEIRSFRH